MATTFIHGWAANEDSEGRMISGPTVLARKETPEEEALTARYALAAFRLAGMSPRPCQVRFYGDIAQVIVDGRAMVVKPEDVRCTITS